MSKKFIYIFLVISIFSCEKLSQNIDYALEDVTPQISPTLNNNQKIAGDFNFKANTSDKIKISVVMAEFYINNSLKTTLLNNPFQFSLDTTKYSDGKHSLEVKIYYSSGHVGTYSRNIIVANHNQYEMEYKKVLNIQSSLVTNTALNSGKYVVAYYNESANKGHHIVYNANGTIHKNPDFFYNATIKDIAISSLAKSDYILSFIDSNNIIYYKMYNKNGEYLSKQGSFGTNMSEISSTTYNSGTLISVSSNDFNSLTRLNTINSTNGNIEEYFGDDLNSNSISNISTTYTNNDFGQDTNIVVAFKKINNKGHLYLFKGLGTLEIVDGIEFSYDDINTNIATTTLPNKNYIVSYNGKFDIFHNNSTTLLTSVVFDKEATEIALTAMNDGSIAIAYKNNMEKGMLSIYSNNGTQLIGPIIFSNENPESIKISQITNNKLLISYSNPKNNNYITSVIYKPK